MKSQSQHQSQQPGENILQQSNSEATEQLLVDSSGETVLLQSGGGLSFGFTAMEIPNSSSAAAAMQRPSSVMQPERPSSRSSNSSRR